MPTSSSPRVCNNSGEASPTRATSSTRGDLDLALDLQVLHLPLIFPPFCVHTLSTNRPQLTNNQHHTQPRPPKWYHNNHTIHSTNIALEVNTPITTPSSTVLCSAPSNPTVMTPPPTPDQPHPQPHGHFHALGVVLKLFLRTPCFAVLMSPSLPSTLWCPNVLPCPFHRSHTPLGHAHQSASTTTPLGQK